MTEFFYIAFWNAARWPKPALQGRIIYTAPHCNYDWSMVVSKCTDARTLIPVFATYHKGPVIDRVSSILSALCHLDQATTWSKGTFWLMPQRTCNWTPSINNGEWFSTQIRPLTFASEITMLTFTLNHPYTPHNMIHLHIKWERRR